MKVEVESPQFRPVTITLETREELENLKRTLKISSMCVNDTFTYNLIKELAEKETE